MKKVLKRLLGDPEAKALKRLGKQAEKINELAPKYTKMTDKKLRDRAAEFKKKLENKPEEMDEVLNEVFALTREMSTRVLKMRHFDVQLIGGIVLHEGSIAEMRTGEGKTLVATLPIVLNGMTGKGAHVVTVNDYLAQRDAGWMGALYNAMGLSVGVIIANNSFIYDPDYINEEHDDERMHHLKPCTRQEAYSADVTYGTNNEFGFDYLRDNMVRTPQDLRQRELNFAIVDEVDSILIDEARTPLIISAPASSSDTQYETFAKAVKRLAPDDYELDEKQRSVSLNDQGVEKIEKMLGIDNLYDANHVQAVYHLDQALKAETLFKRDKDYVVTDDGEVIIVDEFTGRLMHGRRYNEGLHQAIEAKEGVSVLQESMTLATISFQNYFRLYNKLSGMTGTAATEAEEFHTIYKLSVVSIPTNKPNQREDLPDRIYKTEKGKFQAIANEVKERQNKGQPVLIGTVSVEKNEYLGNLLSKEGVSHEVLNAKNNEKEAAIVAQAGQKRAVTLATNIAGRGTDIVLGEGVVDLGGLHVIGTERHESRRIDNQLRGRSGRQGDPGSTQFYVSTEDDLMRIFGGERISALMDRLGVDEETPIENKTISKALESAQKKVENINFDSRKHVVQYDDVMNRHRKAIYTQRKRALTSKDVSDEIQEIIDEVVDIVVPSSQIEDDSKAELAEINSIFGFEESLNKKFAQLSGDKLREAVGKAAQKQYKEKAKTFTQEIMHHLERDIYMKVLDDLWMQHLENMQHLREGITWRSIGQKDPLVEYRREGQKFFEQLQVDLKINIVRAIMHAVPTVQEEPEEEIETALTEAAQHSMEGLAADESNQTRTQAKRKARQKSSKTKSQTTSTRSKSTRKKKRKQQRRNRKRNRR